MHPLVRKAFAKANIDPTTLSSTGRYWSNSDTKFFTKTSRNVAQLQGEHESLLALNKTAPKGFVPRSFAVVVNEKETEGAMVSEYFDMGGGGRKDQVELGKRLAEMHWVTSLRGGREVETGGSHSPEEGENGAGTRRYGFSVPTFCGVTEQDNTWSETWKEFFVERRAGDLVRRLDDQQIATLWNKMLEK
jgi:protein-ribulosamine 3-kinase